MLKTALAAAALLSFAAPASASIVFSEDFNANDFRGAVLVQNDTSDRFGDTTYYRAADFNGWTFSGFSNIAVGAANDGDGALHLNEPALGFSGGVAASRAIELEANTDYVLSFLLSGDNRPGQAYDFAASIGNASFTTPGVVLPSGTNPGISYAYGFTSGAAGSYTLTLSQSVTGGSEGSPVVDNVTLATAVPEPATWAMMIGGFGLVGGALRRRRVGLVLRAA